VTHARWVIALILCVLAIGSINSSIAASDGQPTKKALEQPIASTSIVVDRIGDFDYEDDSFSATFWIQSKTNSREGNPLEGLEFVNSVEETSLVKTSMSSKGGMQTYKMLISGTFHHAWRLANYPFDREVLQVVIRDTKQSAGLFKQRPDTSQSGLRKIPRLIGEWKVQGYQLSEESAEKFTDGYLTTRGLEGNKNDSSLVFSINLINAHSKGAFKLLAAGCVAAAIAAMSYTLEPNTSQRYGSLTASLFAAVIGMRSAYSYLGNSQEVTYIEYIYLLIMAQILFSFGYSSYLCDKARNPRKKLRARVDSLRVGIASTTALVVLIGIATANAIFAG